jgi:hypothetical protein
MTILINRPRNTFFERKKIKEERKQQEIKDKYFKIYQFKPKEMKIEEYVILMNYLFILDLK